MWNLVDAALHAHAHAHAGVGAARRSHRFLLDRMGLRTLAAGRHPTEGGAQVDQKLTSHHKPLGQAGPQR
jgi:hypothetical protein